MVVLFDPGERVCTVSLFAQTSVCIGVPQRLLFKGASMGWLVLFFVRVTSLFVPSEEYQQKVESIVPMDQKLAEVDLGDWEYVSVPGRRLNVEHRRVIDREIA